MARFEIKDILYLFNKGISAEDIENFMLDTDSRPIIIIDDNAVIETLYTNRDVRRWIEERIGD